MRYLQFLYIAKHNFILGCKALATAKTVPDTAKTVPEPATL